MTTQRCEVCGRPAAPGFRVCSSGCDLARRLPMGERDLPVSWQLGLVLGGFFLLFNQLLCSVMEAWSNGRGEVVTASRFGLAAFVCGLLVLFLNVALFAVARPKRLLDHVLLAGLALALGGIQVFADSFAYRYYNFLFFSFNLLLSIWLGRGLWRLWSSKKRENGPS